MSRRPWRGLGVLGVGLLLGYTGLQALPSVLVYVPSPSLPKGWYVRAWRQAPLAVGDLVVLTVPASMRPWMPVDLAAPRLLKQIAAVGGMEVCWGPTGMMIPTPSGPWMAYPQHAEGPASRVEEGCRVLGEEELVVIGTHPRSVDSRHIGPVARALVQWQAWPVWTWEAP
jgi:type IV secretory pathway protease TraF